MNLRAHIKGVAIFRWMENNFWWIPISRTDWPCWSLCSANVIDTSEQTFAHCTSRVLYEPNIRIFLITFIEFCHNSISIIIIPTYDVPVAPLRIDVPWKKIIDFTNFHLNFITMCQLAHYCLHKMLPRDLPILEILLDPFEFFLPLRFYLDFFVH